MGIVPKLSMILSSYIQHCTFLPETVQDVSEHLLKYDNSCPEVIKLFSCSTELSMKFFQLINVKRMDGCLNYL